MKVKIGNQTFDSEEVPVAIIMENKDLLAMTTIPLKKDDGLSAYCRFPKDIPPMVARAWFEEACHEIPNATKRINIIMAVRKPGEAMGA